MEIKGQAALVTGGGSGIGADVARHLAQAGAKVAVFDLNAEGAAAVAKEIGGLAVACDVSDAKSGEEAVAKARAAHGPARVLVNVAGNRGLHVRGDSYRAPGRRHDAGVHLRRRRWQVVGRCAC